MRTGNRDVRLAGWVESLWQDVRYAAHGLARQPAFALTGAGVLALAMGLTTSVFTTFNGLLLRPWPVRDPGRVVAILALRGGPVAGSNGFSYVEYEAFRDRARTLDGAIAMRRADVRVGPGGPPAAGWLVSANFFDTLGIDLALGRGFRTADEDPAVVVLSHRYWRRTFSADPAIVGRTIRVDDRWFTVVGVAAPRFAGAAMERHDLWMPFAAGGLLRQEQEFLRQLLVAPEHCCVEVAARLAPGITAAQAREELAAIDARHRATFGLDAVTLRVAGTAMRHNPEGAKAVPVLALLLAAVTLILLLACANVGNLVLARALARHREIAIRLSLGASRRRVVRQLLTEGLVLALAAGAGGLLIASVLPRAALTLLLGHPLEPADLSPDLTVAGFAFGLCLATPVLVGLAPALTGTRTGLLRAGSPATTTRRPLRGVLLAVQVAVTVVLLIAAALLARGIQSAYQLDPGFAVDEVTAVRFAWPDPEPSAAEARAFNQTLLASLRAQGFQAALTARTPLGSSRSSFGVRLPGDAPRSGRAVLGEDVSPGYFDVLRLSIVDGRALTDTDTSGPNIVINESLARALWPGQRAVGKVLVTSKDTARPVVGVARDAKLTALDRVEPLFWQPVDPDRPLTVLARDAAADAAVTVAAPATLARLRTIARAAAPDVPVTVQLLSTVRHAWLDESRAGTTLALSLAALALALAAIGLLGTFWFVVEERRREIGIRLALGAAPQRIVIVLLRSSMTATLGGLAAGLAGAAAARPLVQGWLFGVSPLDPVAYTAVAATLLLAAAAATYGPARRALRIDPSVTLRAE